MRTPSLTPDPTSPGTEGEEMPAFLRAALADDVEQLAVALTEAVLADGLGFKGPFEEFGRIAEPLLLDALGAARRDGAQIANEATASTLARLHSDLTAERNEAMDRFARLVVEKAEQRIRAEFADANLIALAKMYGETCARLAMARYERFRTDRRIRLQRFALREANKYTDYGIGSRAYTHVWRYAQTMSKRARAAEAEILKFKARVQELEEKLRVNSTISQEVGRD